ncbi:MAG: hypothetical protein A3G41_06970 [Elusimicrobia bacterium RIFCSPLOWO2_12_FULL_59_9]|nr:MAG: hypothetical protein A3G41_06970 [Elusimicrobia bacterium RIFCSPLOWO2_12_FULL_59_9]
MQRNAKNYTQLACAWIVLLLILVLARVNHLNAQVSTATISGTVSDLTGAVIPGTTVRVRNVETGVARTLTTNVGGRYSAPELIPGRYELEVTAPGFQTMIRRGITLTVGREAVVNLTLQVGAVAERIEVMGGAPLVETATASVGAFISTQQVTELPLQGRNFESLFYLAPGVLMITTMQPRTRQGAANVPSVAGARARGYEILQDGESIVNVFKRGIGSVTGSSLGTEALAEFQMLTNTYGAQFGGNGFVVNSASKAGTNSLHGSLYGYLRNSALDTRGFFDPTKASFRRFQSGGSVGGPLKKDKMFFFANYEGIWQAQPQTRIATVPDANSRTPSFPRAASPVTYDAIAEALAIYPRPTFNFSPIAGTPYGVGQVTQVANYIAQENYFLGRFDYTHSEKDSFFARSIVNLQRATAPFGGGLGLALPFWPARDVGSNYFNTFTWRRIVSPTLLIATRASFSRPLAGSYGESVFPALQKTFPGAGRVDTQVTIAGLTALGHATEIPSDVGEDRYTVASDIMWTKGSHTLRMGASIARIDSHSFRPNQGMGTWAHQSLPDFLAGRVFTFTGIPGRPEQYPYRDYREYAFRPYIQDDWRVTRRLTLNLGLRWEFNTNPFARHNTLHAVTDYLHGTRVENVPHVFQKNTNWRNLGPRFGFVYDVFGNQKTALRGGFAINYEPPYAGQYNSMFSVSKPWEVFIARNPTFSYPIPDFTVAQSSTAITVGHDWFMKGSPYLMQYNLNVQHEIVESTVLTVGYVGSQGVRLLTRREYNPPTPTFDANGAYHFATLVGGRIVQNPRLNRNFETLGLATNGTTSRYNSMQVSLDRRFRRNVQAQVNYTWSRCIDDGGEPAGSMSGGSSPTIWTNPFDRSIDKGLCYFHAKHMFKANGLVHLPFRGNRVVEGWKLASIVTASTGVPFTVSTGFDLSGLGAGVRPDYVQGCKVHVGTVNQWYNPECFTVYPPGTLGNTGRDTIIGPGLAQVDFTVMKDTTIRESLGMQFRAEFFNLFNRSQFGLPVASLFTAGAVGACTASGAGCARRRADAGQITRLAGNTAGRQIQFGLKFVF